MSFRPYSSFYYGGESRRAQECEVETASPPSYRTRSQAHTKRRGNLVLLGLLALFLSCLTTMIVMLFVMHGSSPAAVYEQVKFNHETSSLVPRRLEHHGHDIDDYDTVAHGSSAHRSRHAAEYIAVPYHHGNASNSTNATATHWMPAANCSTNSTNSTSRLVPRQQIAVPIPETPSPNMTTSRILPRQQIAVPVPETSAPNSTGPDGTKRNPCLNFIASQLQTNIVPVDLLIPEPTDGTNDKEAACMQWIEAELLDDRHPVTLRIPHFHHGATFGPVSASENGTQTNGTQTNGTQETQHRVVSKRESSAGEMVLSPAELWMHRLWRKEWVFAKLVMGNYTEEDVAEAVDAFREG